MTGALSSMPVPPARKSPCAVQIGCHLPHVALAADPTQVAAYFRGVEWAGFDFVSATDHVAGVPRESLGDLRRVPYTYRDPFMELLTTFAFGAAVTSKLSFSSWVLVLPQRETVLAAKQLATLHALSGGRLRIGVGVGWNPGEFKALGASFAHRGKVLDEQIPLLRKLWRDDLVTAHGEHHSWGPVGIAPRPQTEVPLWFGGGGLAALRRVVAWGEGFMPNSYDASSGTAHDVPSLVASMHAMCEDAGRDPSEIGLEGRVTWSASSDFERDLESWQALGATHVGIAPPRGWVASARAHLDAASEHLERARRVLGDG